MQVNPKQNEIKNKNENPEKKCNFLFLQEPHFKLKDQGTYTPHPLFSEPPKNDETNLKK